MKPDHEKLVLEALAQNDHAIAEVARASRMLPYSAGHLKKIAEQQRQLSIRLDAAAKEVGDDD